MVLEAIILLIILVPVIILVLIRQKQEKITDLRKLLRKIGGNFLLVTGILLLFPAFYQFFHGRGGRSGIVLLLFSLLLVFGGHFLARNGKQRRDKEK